MVDLIGALHAEGIHILPGTDDVTGFTVHRELELYVRAGIPAAEVLRMATLDCEIYLRRDQQLGTVEPGKRADFVVLAADPAQDISAVRKARLVVKDDEFLPAVGNLRRARNPPVRRSTCLAGARCPEEVGRRILRKPGAGCRNAAALRFAGR